MASQRHRVVIVGGGLAGLQVARRLATDTRFEVVLIEKRNNPLYAETLRNTLGGTLGKLKRIPAEVTRLEPDSNLVLDNTGTRHEFDSLVLAAGNQSASHGNSGGEDNRLDIYDQTSVDIVLQMVADKPMRVTMLGATHCSLETAARIRSIQEKADIQVVGELSIASTPKLTEEDEGIITKRLEEIGIQLPKIQPNDSSQANGPVMQANNRIAAQVIMNCQDSFTMSRSGLLRTNDLFEAYGYNSIYGVGSCISGSSLQPSSVLYDASYVARVIKAKLKGAEIAEYDPPPSVYRLALGQRWVFYKSFDGTKYGIDGWLASQKYDYRYAKL